MRPGERVRREIRQYRGSTDLCIKKAPFARIVREISDKVVVETAMDNGATKEEAEDATKMRWTSDAMLALQEATEWYGVGLMEDMQLGAEHRGRKTIIPKDLYLVMRLRGIDPGLPRTSTGN